jgi:hypothetical protein
MLRLAIGDPGQFDGNVTHVPEFGQVGGQFFHWK